MPNDVSPARLGGEMHEELGQAQHLGGRLGPHRGRHVLTAGNERESATARCSDRARIEHRAGILQHRHQCHRSLARYLAFGDVEQLINSRELGRALHLGDEQPEGARPARGVRVVEGKPRRDRVDAHEHGRAVAADRRHRVLQGIPRARLLLRRHRVLEIEDDGVGAALVRLGKETLGAGRDIEERADHAAAFDARSAAMPAAS
jgi:hypothetical protein